MLSLKNSLKKHFTFAFILGCTALLSACVYTAQDGKYAEIAQCLTEKNVKFYGAWWCPHCAEQKKIFGDDMRYITYVECDKNGKNANPQACRDAGVTSYPTWVFPGQENSVGVYQPEELAAKANCSVTTGSEGTTPANSPDATQGDTAAPEGTTGAETTQSTEENREDDTTQPTEGTTEPAPANSETAPVG